MTSKTSTDSGCVLIVDDDDLIRETLRELIEMAGCKAMVAANGTEALDVLALHRPCLVILDLLMPGMNGDEVLEVMRSKPELADVNVVISTSAPEQAPAGVTVIPKPVNISVIIDWMRRTCLCANAVPAP